MARDAGLIRYLIARALDSVKCAEINYHVKLPIFVARQLSAPHRHVNEYSARLFAPCSTAVLQPEPGQSRHPILGNRRVAARFSTGAGGPRLIDLLRANARRFFRRLCLGCATR